MILAVMVTHHKLYWPEHYIAYNINKRPQYYKHPCSTVVFSWYYLLVFYLVYFISLLLITFDCCYISSYRTTIECNSNNSWYETSLNSEINSNTIMANGMTLIRHGSTPPLSTPLGVHALCTASAFLSGYSIFDAITACMLTL